MSFFSSDCIYSGTLISQCCVFLCSQHGIFLCGNVGISLPQFLGSGREFVTRKHDGDKLISFERGGLVWVLNFHPSQSFVDYRIAVERAGR